MFSLGDYQSQIRWGLSYISSVYGSPAAAYSAWLSRSPHWYHEGGPVGMAAGGPVGMAAGGPALPKGLPRNAWFALLRGAQAAEESEDRAVLRYAALLYRGARDETAAIKSHAHDEAKLAHTGTPAWRRRMHEALVKWRRAAHAETAVARHRMALNRMVSKLEQRHGLEAGLYDVFMHGTTPAHLRQLTHAADLEYTAAHHLEGWKFFGSAGHRLASELRGTLHLLGPLGFTCDHVEVLYDLDVEAAKVARRAGVAMVRAETVGEHPGFIQMIAQIAAHYISPASIRRQNIVMRQ